MSMQDFSLKCTRSPQRANSYSHSHAAWHRPNTRAAKKEDIGSSAHLLDNLAKLLNLFEPFEWYVMRCGDSLRTLNPLAGIPMLAPSSGRRLAHPLAFLGTTGSANPTLQGQPQTHHLRAF